MSHAIITAKKNKTNLKTYLYRYFYTVNVEIKYDFRGALLEKFYITKRFSKVTSIAVFIQ